MQHVTASAASTNFQLKTQSVQLLPSSRQQSATIALADLEAFRVSALATPASKHGLEAITGASCETGAQ